MDGAAEVSSDPFAVDIDRFQGPLDLLLHLIRNQDIDIFDIPISRVTEQFLAVIRGVTTLELERAGEFLEMAAMLVRIKAQMLFPRRSEDPEDEDPRADLVRRLLEYEHFREAATVLDGAERERARLFPRGFVEVRVSHRARDLPLQVEWREMWDAVLKMGDRLAEPPRHTVQGRAVRIEDKMLLVREALRHSPRVEFTDLVAPWGTRMHAVAALLACLELAKRSAVRIRQSGPFAKLWVLRARGEE